MTDVEREVVLPAPPEDVWEELADPGRLGGWFGAEIDGELAEGEVVRFGDDRAVVERVEAPRRLAFRWLPDDTTQASRVEITIDEVGNGSVVRVVERKIDPAVTPKPEIGFRALVGA